MEKYVMFRGKVIDKWYDFDKRAHYHIVAMDDEGKRFDLAVNIGSIYEKMNEIVSSNLKVYYDENYNCRKRIAVAKKWHYRMSQGFISGLY